MDPTVNIRDVPANVKKEYAKMAAAIHVAETRENQKEIMNTMMSGLSQEAKEHFKFILRREKIHYDFMLDVVPKAYEMKYRKPLPAERNPHDCTKDDLFAFVMAANFDLFFRSSDNQAPEELDPEFKKKCGAIVKSELDRHYFHEAHHPEHEALAGKECSDEDILEMAVDRLARNVQFNMGKVDMVKMEKFLPKFVLGDVERKNKLYWDNVLLCQQLVSDRAVQLYFQ